MADQIRCIDACNDAQVGIRYPSLGFGIPVSWLFVKVNKCSSWFFLETNDQPWVIEPSMCAHFAAFFALLL
jgi:hypothetical protein